MTPLLRSRHRVMTLTSVKSSRQQIARRQFDPPQCLFISCPANRADPPPISANVANGSIHALALRQLGIGMGLSPFLNHGRRDRSGGCGAETSSASAQEGCARAGKAA
ncbi:hypothetical protein [Rhizobium bangladeshense]|uniref:hypothetical protein n=1 Tax=Rhizobium bangladeshense TaxID=1138189 RepID=UPI0012E72A8B|nr:hypothetical protein [Rhizobium bangladeshense]